MWRLWRSETDVSCASPFGDRLECGVNSSMVRGLRIAVVYGSPVGVGGLGVQSLNAIDDLAGVADQVIAIGPGAPAHRPASISWHEVPRTVSPFPARYTWLRWLQGRFRYLEDRGTGSNAAAAVAAARPDVCYCFTQVALETLRWANRARVPAILESPNGHIRNFREVYVRETRRLSR